MSNGLLFLGVGAIAAGAVYLATKKKDDAPVVRRNPRSPPPVTRVPPGIPALDPSVFTQTSPGWPSPYVRHS